MVAFTTRNSNGRGQEIRPPGIHSSLDVRLCMPPIPDVSSQGRAAIALERKVERILFFFLPQLRPIRQIRQQVGGLRGLRRSAAAPWGARTSAQDKL
jgi:hypothetical protein